MSSQYISVTNRQSVDWNSVPRLNPGIWTETILGLTESASMHPVAYFAVPDVAGAVLVCAIANDAAGLIYVFASEPLAPGVKLPSAALLRPAFHGFEREIAEMYDIMFEGHPRPNPWRYDARRLNPGAVPENFSFYTLTGGHTHQVGVGPIHAGIIEPGHFRFQCTGETVKHLEIQLGWQHRGTEAVMLEKKSLIARTVLAENIAGDTVVGHTLAFAGAMESMAGIIPSDTTRILRTIAMELERMAMHTAGLSGLCTDIAYRSGDTQIGALRTPLINFFQDWCGNRLARGLVRVGYSPYLLDNRLMVKLLSATEDYIEKIAPIFEELFNNASVQARFTGVGVVTHRQALALGAVGQTARMAGLFRDVRKTHPTDYYATLPPVKVLKQSGDVMARALLKAEEIEHSAEHIQALLKRYKPCPRDEDRQARRQEISLKPNQLCISMTEGWRGQIAHTYLTGPGGEIIHAKITDPSFFNWTALELALRENGISDFPINNKSFNLSYCGNDL